MDLKILKIRQVKSVLESRSLSLSTHHEVMCIMSAHLNSPLVIVH